VRTLGERDASALADLTAELALLEDADAFPPHLLATLAQLVPSETVFYNEIDRGRDLKLVSTWWHAGVGGSDPPEEDTPGPEHDPYFLFWEQHPTCSYRAQSNDWTSPRKASDFVTLREFRRTEIWNELYRDEHLQGWLDVGLTPVGRRTRVFGFKRVRGDFDERDRLVLDLLQPHLQRRQDRVQEAAEAALALATLEEQAEEDPRHIVLCSNGGVIEFGSPRARRLLAAYLRCTNGRLPASVLHETQGRPKVVEQDAQRLIVRAVRTGELVVLLLTQEDLRLDLLTRRQRVILERVASGETDAQIAGALGIAPSTVNKHLEQIYRRLGVHTRTAAAAFAKRASG
jgi:DNA-binding CsgD family transcriptional regulator